MILTVTTTTIVASDSGTLMQHLHEVLTATEAGRDSDINNSMENIMPRVKLIDASLKVHSISLHCALLCCEAETNAQCPSRRCTSE